MDYEITECELIKTVHTAESALKNYAREKKEKRNHQLIDVNKTVSDASSGCEFGSTTLNSLASSSVDKDYRDGSLSPTDTSPVGIEDITCPFSGSLSDYAAFSVSFDSIASPLQGDAKERSQLQSVDEQDELESSVSEHTQASCDSTGKFPSGMSDDFKAIHDALALNSISSPMDNRMSILNFDQLNITNDITFSNELTQGCISFLNTPTKLKENLELLEILEKHLCKNEDISLITQSKIDENVSNDGQNIEVHGSALCEAGSSCSDEIINHIGVDPSSKYKIQQKMDDTYSNKSMEYIMNFMKSLDKIVGKGEIELPQKESVQGELNSTFNKMDVPIVESTFQVENENNCNNLTRPVQIIDCKEEEKPSQNMFIYENKDKDCAFKIASGVTENGKPDNIVALNSTFDKKVEMHDEEDTKNVDPKPLNLTFDANNGLNKNMNSTFNKLEDHNKPENLNSSVNATVIITKENKNETFNKEEPMNSTFGVDHPNTKPKSDENHVSEVHHNPDLKASQNIIQNCLSKATQNHGDSKFNLTLGDEDDKEVDLNQTCEEVGNGSFIIDGICTNLIDMKFKELKTVLSSTPDRKTPRRGRRSEESPATHSKLNSTKLLKRLSCSKVFPKTESSKLSSLGSTGSTPPVKDLQTLVKQESGMVYDASKHEVLRHLRKAGPLRAMPLLKRNNSPGMGTNKRAVSTPVNYLKLGRIETSKDRTNSTGSDKDKKLPSFGSVSSIETDFVSLDSSPEVFRGNKDGPQVTSTPILVFNNHKLVRNGPSCDNPLSTPIVAPADQKISCFRHSDSFNQNSLQDIGFLNYMEEPVQDDPKNQINVSKQEAEAPEPDNRNITHDIINQEAEDIQATVNYGNGIGKDVNTTSVINSENKLNCTNEQPPNRSGTSVAEKQVDILKDLEKVLDEPDTIKEAKPKNIKVKPTLLPNRFSTKYKSNETKQLKINFPSTRRQSDQPTQTSNLGKLKPQPSNTDRAKDILKKSPINKRSSISSRTSLDKVQSKISLDKIDTPKTSLDKIPSARISGVSIKSSKQNSLNSESSSISDNSAKNVKQSDFLRRSSNNGQKSISTGSTASKRMSTGSTASNKLSTGSTASTKISNGSTASKKISTGSTAGSKMSNGSTASSRISTGSTASKRISTGSTTVNKTFDGKGDSKPPITGVSQSRNSSSNATSPLSKSKPSIASQSKIKSSNAVNSKNSVLNNIKDPQNVLNSNNSASKVIGHNPSKSSTKILHHSNLAKPKDSLRSGKSSIPNPSGASSKISSGIPTKKLSNKENTGYLPGEKKPTRSGIPLPRSFQK